MIAIIDYNAGDIVPYANLIKEITNDFVITGLEKDVCKADKIIVPGSGEPCIAVRRLNLVNLTNLLRILKKPCLGIGLGAQILCEKSEEGDIPGLGIFPQTVSAFDKEKIQTPHIGWENVQYLKESKLFTGIPDGEKFYFEHSYYIPMNEYSIAKSTYGLDYSAAIEKNNYFGVQFHIEKSGDAGLKLLRNFIELC